MNRTHDFWHLPRRRRGRTVRLVEGRGLDRLGILAGLLAWLAVGAAAGVQQMTGEPVIDQPIWWWGAYLTYGVLLALSDAAVLDRNAHLRMALLFVQVLLGLTVFALAPEWGFSSVLLVISAAYATYVVRLRASLALVAVQTLATVPWTLQVDDLAWAFASAAVYGGFQLFAVLMVETSLRESEARQTLTKLNVELEAAQSLLAETSRATERLRIARDLHDMVGHQLTGLALELEVARHHAQGRSREHVERARLAAKALLSDVREAVGQLREAPADLAAELRSVTGVAEPTIHLQLPPDLASVDAEPAQTLIRCIQEIVTNTVRHAAADNLWIEVSTDNGRIRVRACDDGGGTAELRPGNGLLGMRERFELLGGHVCFATGRGEGFRVLAVLPR